MKDRNFTRNWYDARRAGIMPGAYHYFYFCTPGYIQARNFIDSVPKEMGTLPPVVDVEPRGDCIGDFSRVQFYLEIGDFLQLVENYYGAKPIIYTTISFENFFKNERFLLGYPIWLRDIISYPGFSRSWSRLKFWQCTSRGRIGGIRGSVDVDLFLGTLRQLRSLVTRPPITKAKF